MLVCSREGLGRGSPSSRKQKAQAISNTKRATHCIQWFMAAHLARPKSQSLSLQLAFAKMFFGFRSLQEKDAGNYRELAVPQQKLTVAALHKPLARGRGRKEVPFPRERQRRRRLGQGTRNRREEWAQGRRRSMEKPRKHSVRNTPWQEKLQGSDIRADTISASAPVEHARGVHEVEATQQLVQEDLVVIVGKIIVCCNDGVEVRLHELKHDVQVLEGARVRGQEDVLDIHNVRVLQQAQQLDLAEDAQGVCHVLKDVLYLLDGNHLPCYVVLC